MVSSLVPVILGINLIKAFCILSIATILVLSSVWLGAQWGNSWKSLKTTGTSMSQTDSHVISKQEVVFVEEEPGITLQFVHEFLTLLEHQGRDFKSLTLGLRLFKRLFSRKMTNKLSSGEQLIYDGLETQMFAWIRGPTFKSVEEVWKYGKEGRGIVLTTGNRYFHLALHLIRSIRHFDCRLPVVVYYLGPEDLDLKARNILDAMENVSTVDMMEMFDTKALDLQRGWDMKPFAILASPFSETMLVDADAVFMQNPEKVFEDSGYSETGALYFPDRTLLYHRVRNKEWIDRVFLPPFSEYTLASRFYNNKSAYEVESGVVVIHKTQRFIGLLAACQLNAKVERGIVREMTYGEKETFWLGFDMVEEPFSMVPTPAGSIGIIERDGGTTKICGKLAHFDRSGNLFWFNDGIVENKYAEERKLASLKSYGMEGTWKRFCLVAEFKDLDEQQESLLQELGKYYESNPAGEDI
jgi:hypothetical protein